MFRGGGRGCGGNSHIEHRQETVNDERDITDQRQLLANENMCIKGGWVGVLHKIEMVLIRDIFDNQIFNWITLAIQKLIFFCTSDGRI